MSRRARAVTFAALFGACANDHSAGDPCARRRCVTAPPPLCEGTLKVVFQAIGTCSSDVTGTATCNYPIAQQQDCHDLGKICEGGACVTAPVEKCQGVVCQTRPAPDCDANTARIFGASGTCDPDVGEEGECVYPVEDIFDCTQTHRACVEGACIDPAEHPCAPSPCDVPPQGTCAGNVPTAYAATGTCSEATVDGKPVAQCDYAATTHLACTGSSSSCWLGLCAHALRAPAAAGDLIITEVAKNPAVQGDVSEWFEVHDPSDDALQLDGCVVSDEGGESFAIASGTIIPSHGWFVFGHSADVVANGGFAPDYLYAGMVLANAKDELIITCGGVVIDRVAWGAGWPSAVGRTMSLGTDPPNASTNDNLAAWCDAPARYGDGTNLGSPRRPNPPCP